MDDPEDNELPVEPVVDPSSAPSAPNGARAVVENVAEPIVLSDPEPPDSQEDFEWVSWRCNCPDCKTHTDNVAMTTMVAPPEVKGAIMGKVKAAGKREEQLTIPDPRRGGQKRETLARRRIKGKQTRPD